MDLRNNVSHLIKVSILCAWCLFFGICLCFGNPFFGQRGQSTQSNQDGQSGQNVSSSESGQNEQDLLSVQSGQNEQNLSSVQSGQNEQNLSSSESSQGENLQSDTEGANSAQNSVQSVNSEQSATEVEVFNTKNIMPVRVGKTNPNNVKAQGHLREEIASFFRTWKTSVGTNKTKIMWGVILASFLYGILHAIGPGHRKTIVFSLYIARKAAWWEPAFTGFALSALHGGCAILLMLIFKGVSGSIAAETDMWATYLEGFSYILVIATAFVLLIKETFEFTKTYKLRNVVCDSNKNLIIENGKSLIPFLISGAYPCPGAILVLVLSFTLDILPLGIIAVLCMSLGMSIPIIGAGYLAWFGRKGLFSVLKEKQHITAIVAYAIETFGYILLIGFSIYIGLPFFLGLLG